MQDAEIHWNGEAIAVVLAETQEQADHAKSLIRVTYQTEGAMVNFDVAKAHAHLPGSVLGEKPKLEIGDAEAALAAAPYQVDLTYRTPDHNHNAIELHAVTLFFGKTANCLSMMLRKLWCRLGGRWLKFSGLRRSRCMSLLLMWAEDLAGKTLWPHHVLAAAGGQDCAASGEDGAFKGRCVQDGRRSNDD